MFKTVCHLVGNPTAQDGPAEIALCVFTMDKFVLTSADVADFTLTTREQLIIALTADSKQVIV